jgi:hypothetical protein
MGSERVQVTERRAGEGDLVRGRGGPAGAVRKSVQASLVVGRSDDPLEREADHVAAQVLASLSGRVGYAGRGASPTRIRRARFAGTVVGPEGGTADGQLTSRIRRTEGRGQPLDPSNRSAMEGAFGVDLGRVRVHTTAESADLNEALGARAFTYGTDIHLGAGAPDPGSVEGTRLLAHELAHVVQQGGGGVRRSTDLGGPSSCPQEVGSPTRSRLTASSARVVRRLVIPRSVTGLKGPVDTSPPKGFAEAVATLYNEAVLLEMKGQIEAERNKPGLAEDDASSMALALDEIRDRLTWLGVRRGEWSGDDEPFPRVQPTDARYKEFGVKASLDMAERLIDNALSRLGSISASTPADNPTMRIFRSFFTTARPGGIMGRLRYVKNQLRHYRPQCPSANESKGGGHVCLDPDMPQNQGYQYQNFDVGADARMVIGPKAMKMTPGARAYNVIHEATHATRGLSTVDHGYRWQRIFAYLTPQQQLENADSYAMLVGVLAGLTEATADMTDEKQLKYDLPATPADIETLGLSQDLSVALNTSWAWFEYYATELRKNFTDLRSGVSSDQPFVDGSHQKRLYEITADVYGLGSKDDVRAVPVVEEIADDMQDACNYSAFGKPVFCLKEPATPLDEDDDRFPVIVPARVGNELTSMILWHFEVWCTVKGRPAERGEKYKELVPRVVKMSNWAGPLST